MMPRRALKKGMASAMIQATMVMAAMRAIQTSQPLVEWMRRMSELGRARLRM